ncbi:hypothetical protein SLS56_000825 [Neofusicoccum ribis]|uniref:Uncharacterized protein n=1 Tax=Neofusicoccum ribis TaxID=45134 RepID=A0ABR3TCP6_9PEZI
MEQTILSFSDFMKTLPPSGPPSTKPLPPAPHPQRPSPAPLGPSQSSSVNSYSRASRSEPSLRTRLTSSESDAEAEEERAPDVPEDFFLQPATYTVSSPGLSKPEGKHRPALEPRKFELLIPDSSPHLGPSIMTPAFEYEHHIDLPPSPASSNPPQTPLPPISGATSLAKLKEPSALKKTPTPPSPTSTKSTRTMQSPTVALSEAQLAVSPFSLATPVSPSSREWSKTPQSPPWSRDFSQYAQRAQPSVSARRLVPRSAAPGADDEWEDIEERRRIRRDRISKDYHTTLVEQYRDLVSPSDEIFADEKRWTLWTSYGTPFQEDGLVPSPLSTSKTSVDRYGIVDRSSPFPEDHYRYEEPLPRSYRRKSSIREKLPALAAGTLNMILPSQHSRKSSATSSRSGDIPISPPADHERFTGSSAQNHSTNSPRWARPTPKQRPRSRVFPVVARPLSGVYAMTRAKPILKSVRKKKKDKKSSKHQPPSHTPPLTLTLVPSSLTKPIPSSSRTPSRHPSATSSTYSASSSASRLVDPRPAPPPTTKTPAAPSPLHRGLTHTELFSPDGLDLHLTYPRKLSTGLPSTPSRQKPSTSISTSTARAALTGVQNALGMLRTATPSPAPARLPFAHEKRGAPTLDPSSPSLSLSSSSSRASSSTAVATKSADKGARGSHVRVRSLATGGALEEQADGAGVVPRQQVSLVRRAVEAHRNHRRERQKAEMKKSIRVLGQTDPQVVQGYVRVAAGAVAGPGVRPIYRRGSGGEGWL